MREATWRSVGICEGYAGKEGLDDVFMVGIKDKESIGKLSSVPYVNLVVIEKSLNRRKPLILKPHGGDEKQWKGLRRGLKLLKQRVFDAMVHLDCLFIRLQMS